MDLGLNRDFGYKEQALKGGASYYILKHTGYSWEDLIEFVESDKLPRSVY